MSFRRLGVRERIGMLLFLLLIFIVGTTAYYYNRHNEEEEVTDVDCSIYQKTTETDYVGNDTTAGEKVFPRKEGRRKKARKASHSKSRKKAGKAEKAKNAEKPHRRFEKDTVPRIRR